MKQLLSLVTLACVVGGVVAVGALKVAGVIDADTAEMAITLLIGMATGGTAVALANRSG